MEPFKNMLSPEVARVIGKAVGRGYPAFQQRRYERGLAAALEPLELKDRMLLIATRVEHNLPEDPAVLFPILEQALAQSDSDSDGLRGFPVWPLTEIVARRGMEAFPLAMHALGEMTKCFTAEFAIRPFLRSDLTRTLTQLRKWSTSRNEHLRRLASEGSRPILPWGERLPAILAAPTLTLPILNQLHADPSDYVRRSVANHLNDFSKTNPDHVIATLQKWRKEVGAKFPQTAARAARTLVKAGHPDALELIGFRADAALELRSFTLPDTIVQIGEKLAFELEIRNLSTTETAVLFDYAIHYRKSAGHQTRKVFKGRNRTLASGEVWKITGAHSFRPVTTRTYHPGEHQIEPIINGRVFAPEQFTLR